MESYLSHRHADGDTNTTIVDSFNVSAPFLKARLEDFGCPAETPAAAASAPVVDGVSCDMVGRAIDQARRVM